MNKQAQQLATLTSVVSAQDRLIDRRLQRIQHLEQQVGALCFRLYAVYFLLLEALWLGLGLDSFYLILF